MPEIALYQPEIPPNTGNIIRLCANMGFGLHLIHPLGFDLSSKQCRRAGLDYREMANVTEHASFEDFQAAMAGRHILACTTKTSQFHNQAEIQQDSVLLFGPETRGLPAEYLASLPLEQKIRIPMREGSRSMNLSNAVAVIAYESWRQLGFDGGV